MTTMKRLMVTLLVALVAINNLSAQRNKRQLWDVFITPKVGANYSNFTSGGGEYKLGVVGGLSAEVFLLPKLSFDAGLSYAHQGSHNYLNPQTQQLNDARVEMLNMDYLFHVYPFGRFNIFTGIHIGQVIGASVCYEDVKDELHDGEFAIPVGLGYDLGPVNLEARFQYSLKKLPKTELAKNNMGDVSLMSFWFTVGYKIQVF